MKKVLLLLIIIISQTGWGQNNIEQLRSEAYEARMDNDKQKAIGLYYKILQINPNDYDAQLAIARLYFTTENYQKSIAFFNKIYKNDKTDVEALKGLGDNYLYIDKIDKAIGYYQKALSYLPTHVPTYLQLAKAYSWQGKLDKAIATYQKILKIDDTYAEAYQGIGKMYYWKEQPNTALKFYQKAIALDPQEMDLQKEYQDIKKQTALSISSASKYVNETEESYQIDALIEQISLHKRMFDHLDLSLHVLADYSTKNYTSTNVGDTTRWYNAAWFKVGWLTNHHKIYLYSGYSASDEKLSTYGLNWQWNFPFKSFDITNNFTSGYDYFYYWNKVGKIEVNDDVKIKYNKFTLNIGANFGLVDKAFILDIANDRYTDDDNTFMGYNSSLQYQVFASPKVNIGVNYSYLDYQYKSNRYYSPQGRNLYGPSANIYYKSGDFYFYGDASYNLGEEYYYENIPGRRKSVTRKYINANNWSASGEFGYDYKKWSSSVSAGRFYNDYYNNLSVAFNLKYTF